MNEEGNDTAELENEPDGATSRLRATEDAEAEVID